jgi:hypothetical protein
MRMQACNEHCRMRRSIKRFAFPQFQCCFPVAILFL